MGEEKSLSKHVQVRVAEDEYAWLDESAKRSSIQAIVRDLIVRAMATDDPGPFAGLTRTDRELVSDVIRMLKGSGARYRSIIASTVKIWRENHGE